MATKKKELEQPKANEKVAVIKNIKMKAPLEKVNIIAKQIGKNLNVVVGNEKFTRVGTKEELQVVKDVISAYDAKPTKANLEPVMIALKPVTTAKIKEEEKVKAEIKETKHKIKETSKEVKTKKTKVDDVVKEIDDKLMSDDELDKMQTALDRQKEKRATIAKPAPAACRYGGEH